MTKGIYTHIIALQIIAGLEVVLAQLNLMWKGNHSVSSRMGSCALNSTQPACTWLCYCLGKN